MSDNVEKCFETDIWMDSMAIGTLEVTTHEIQWDWMIIPSSVN